MQIAQAATMGRPLAFNLGLSSRIHSVNVAGACVAAAGAWKQCRQRQGHPVLQGRPVEPAPMAHAGGERAGAV